MRILWYADFNDKQYRGGAQQTDRILIDYGRYIGIEIKEINLSDALLVKESDISGYDAVVLSNIYILHGKLPNLIGEMMRLNKKVIRFEHDYLWMARVDDHFTQNLFQMADLSIFLSPLHLIEHLEHGVIPKNPVLIPPPAGLVQNLEGEHKPNTVVYAGEIHVHKGIQNVLAYAREHQEMQVDLYGWVEDKSLLEEMPDNALWKGEIPHRGISKVFSKYEYMIHMPNWREPFGRSVMEAKLAGCKLILNENVGFSSWGFDTLDSKALGLVLNAQMKNFWGKITSL